MKGNRGDARRFLADPYPYPVRGGVMLMKPLTQRARGCEGHDWQMVGLFLHILNRPKNPLVPNASIKPSREAAAACMHCEAASPRATRPLRRRTYSLLRSPWPCLAAGCIEGDRGTDERLERARVDLLPLMDVNRAPYVPVEARVEELGRVLQRSPLGESELHDGLVRLASA